MKSKKLINTLSYLFFMALGIFLFYKTFQNSDFGSIFQKLQSVNYWWLLAVLASTIVGHWARNERWHMLLKASEQNPNRWQVFSAMMIGYFVNLGIPRLGEISRSVVIKKKEGVPFNTTIGTVIIERVVDIISLLLVVITVAFFEYEKIKTFLIQHIFPILSKLGNLILNKALFSIIGITLLLIITFVFRQKLIEVLKKLTQISFIANFKNGLLSIFRLQHTSLFFLYTIIIWIGYFLTSYLCFFTLTESSTLGLEAGFVVLAFGSISRSLPIQGGSMGAYHFTVTQILLLFGISQVTGESIAIIIHSTQLLFQAIVGGVCCIIFFFTPNYKK
ncbi:MAG: flippase-like domain-containing protein [Cytophagales bacterium]|nr:flippase-like domain-containing protein [Cytophagales bacterium]